MSITTTEKYMIAYSYAKGLQDAADGLKSIAADPKSLTEIDTVESIISTAAEVMQDFANEAFTKAEELKIREN